MRQILILAFIILAAIWLSGCTTTDIERVNFDVNAYDYVADTKEDYGVKDITLTGSGDCEDFAFEKCKRLKALGYKTELVYRFGPKTKARELITLP